MTKSIYEQLPLSSIPTSSEVVWSDTGKVGFTHSGGTITRTGSAGWGLSKMQSDKTFTVGEGIIQIDFSTLGAFASGSLMLGLNSGTLGYYYQGTPYNPADFSIYMAGGDQVEVYENQVKKYGSGGGRNDADKFRITIDNSGIVRYFCQPLGQGLYDLHYTSTVIASGTYFIQTNAYTGSSPSGICSSSEQTLPPLKQRFVETFSGGVLDTDRWETKNNYSTNTFEMVDEIDGGFKILNNASGSADGQIWFNGKDQFAHNGSVCITVAKAHTITGGGEMYIGLTNNTYIASGSVKSTAGIRATASAFFVQTNDQTTNSWTTTGVPKDTDWHTFRTELNGSSCVGTVDGTATTTKTSNMPISAMEPSMEIYDNAQEVRVRYFEVYNT